MVEGGGFGRNAGPRGDYQGPLPDFGSAARNWKPLRRADLNARCESAYLAPKRPLANNVWKRTQPLGETQTATHARSRQPSDTEMHYHVSKNSRSRSRQSDFMPRTPSHVNTGRKQAAYDNFILDDVNVRPSRGNQHSKENHFPSPTVQPRKHVLPQTSQKKKAATQRSVVLTNHKSLPSHLHAVKNSGLPFSQILAEREEEAKARRLARFGAELSQPVVEMVEPPVSNVESSKQQADVDFLEETAIVGLRPDMCPEPERGERPTKGDLDKHKRLNGDRNITTEFHAVKKLRTEALACQHSSFPSNKGMPLVHLENILPKEGLTFRKKRSEVEHYDFVLKRFEEMYIVKKGPFLRQGDPLKRTPLVGKKRSLKIKSDVCSYPVLNTASVEDVSCSLKVSGTKRVSPEKPATEISDSAKLIKVPDQAQAEFQPGGGSLEEEDMPVIPVRAICVPVITERPSDVPVIPLCHFPMSPIGTDFLPVLPASNAHRLITSNLTAVNVSPSTVDDEREIYPVDESQENMKVFRDKMKPIFRRWRQRTTEIRLQREKKERKEVLVREALESVPVGPLLRTSAYKAPRKEMLNIDRAIRARLRKQAKSWSLLNTSELVTPIIAEQNPNARCLCWKLLLSLPADPTDTLPIKWLLTKFNLLETGSFVSISKTWSDPLLSLSFVRADKTGPFEKRSVAGASSILFLLSGDTPLEVHKARLHNLCSHIPANSNLPLLIAIEGHLNGEEETTIIAKLGLADIEQTKLRGISVIYLNQNRLLDDGRLREGVRWLAEHSPPQSDVSLVDTRTILLSYLKLKLEVLGDACEVGPDQCIGAVNESIDWLITAILASASANPNFWPCPETDLLQKYSGERNYAEMTLPRATWSEPQKVQAQIDILTGCKLPCFGFDRSWLGQGSSCTDKKQVQDQKRGLEEYLFNYLNLYTGSQEAMDEARKLVQRCTSLVLRDSCFYLVPRWTAIFRRILNLRLITIPKDASDVYVSENIANVQTFVVGWKDLLVSEELPLVPLNEMIERCFVVADAALPTVPVMSDVHADTAVPTIPVMSDVHADTVVPTYKDEASDSIRLPEKNKKQTLSVLDGRFQLLLEQCTKVQEEIDKKLFIYF